MISIVPADGGRPDRDARTAAVYRDGISSARRELQAGSARRYRTDPDAPSSPRGSTGAAAPARSAVDRTAPAVVPPSAVDASGSDRPGSDLERQRAGVRAALAELRQHRGPR